MLVHQCPHLETSALEGPSLPCDQWYEASSTTGLRTRGFGITAALRCWTLIGTIGHVMPPKLTVGISKCSLYCTKPEGAAGDIRPTEEARVIIQYIKAKSKQWHRHAHDTARQCSLDYNRKAGISGEVWQETHPSTGSRTVRGAPCEACTRRGYACAADVSYCWRAAGMLLYAVL